MKGSAKRDWEVTRKRGEEGSSVERGGNFVCNFLDSPLAFRTVFLRAAVKLGRVSRGKVSWNEGGGEEGFSGRKWLQ